jgi:hypothetical protein
MHGPEGGGPAMADHHERLTVIQFVWMSPTGVQPVLFVERVLLQ